jgi:valyl-tRNA synthetase
MPFVTEEVWQRFGVGQSIMVAPWPESQPAWRDADAEDRFGFVMDLVTEIRRFRTSHGIRESMSLSAKVHAPDPARHGALVELRPEIQRLAGLSTLEVVDGPEDPAGAARLLVGGAEVLLPLAGVLDPETERARLSKRLDALRADAAKVSAKLANAEFVAKAPAEVVAKERAKLEEFEGEAAAVTSGLAELG